MVVPSQIGSTWLAYSGNQGKREGFLRAINRTLGAINRILRKVGVTSVCRRWPVPLQATMSRIRRRGTRCARKEKLGRKVTNEAWSASN